MVVVVVAAAVRRGVRIPAVVVTDGTVAHLRLSVRASLRTRHENIK